MEDRNSSEPAFDFISPLTFIITASGVRSDDFV